MSWLAADDWNNRAKAEAAETASAQKEKLQREAEFTASVWKTNYENNKPNWKEKRLKDKIKKEQHAIYCPNWSKIRTSEKDVRLAFDFAHGTEYIKVLKSHLLEKLKFVKDEHIELKDGPNGQLLVRIKS